MPQFELWELSKRVFPRIFFALCRELKSTGNSGFLTTMTKHHHLRRSKCSRAFHLFQLQKKQKKPGYYRTSHAAQQALARTVTSDVGAATTEAGCQTLPGSHIVGKSEKKTKKNYSNLDV